MSTDTNTTTVTITTGQDLKWPVDRSAIQHFVDGRWVTHMSGSDRNQMRNSWDSQAGFVHVPRRLVLSGIVVCQD